MVQKFFCLLQSIFVFVKHKGVQNKARQSMYYTLIKFQTKKGMLACGNLPSFKDVCLCCLSFTFQILLSFVRFFSSSYISCYYYCTELVTGPLGKIGGSAFCFSHAGRWLSANGERKSPRAQHTLLLEHNQWLLPIREEEEFCCFRHKQILG